MEHNWSNSDERKQWECLNCGATIRHEITTSKPTADHVQHAQQPGTAEDHLHKVRSVECPGT